MEKLLVVADLRTVRNQLKWGLAQEYLILEAADRAQAMELFLRHAPKVAMLDLGLSTKPHVASEGDSEGFRCLEWMVERRPETKVVVLIGREERETAYRAVNSGAYDFYRKPVELAELKIVIRRAFHLSGMEEQAYRLQEALQRGSASVEGIAGQCAAMQKLFSTMQRVTDVQELAARQIGCGPEPAGWERGWGGNALLAAEHEAQVSTSQQQGEVTFSTERLTLREVRDRVEKGMITAAVGNCGGNIVRAAELLGVSRPALYDLLKKHGLFKSGARQ